MPSSDYDALFLYNERETAVDTIATELQAIGYRVFIWRKDVAYGTEIEEDETSILKTVPVVLVFLGRMGWGPNHLRRFMEARKMDRNVIPVLIGETSDKDLEEADGFFRRKRYVDLTKITHASISNLVKAIGEPKSKLDTSQYDREVNILRDGSDDQRIAVLERIQAWTDLLKATLAKRLRDEVEERFNPLQDTRNASSTVRNPEKISSIRSWMLSCIIWADPENPLNKDLILRHLDPEYEKNDSVQYWVLAGLYMRRVSYLDKAASIQIEYHIHAEVYLLARAIRGIDDSFILECSSGLNLSNSENAWQVLRMLRIISIPALVPDICQLLISKPDLDPLTYDALFALANDGMAEAAATLLTEVPGIMGITVKIINVLADSWGYTVRVFARILLPLDAHAVDAALADLRNNPQTRLNANKLRNVLAELREGDGSTAFSYRRNISDGINVAHDLLNIKKDVKTLSAIVAAKGASLPLAIGLLGGWGTGKSFFMQSMQEEIKDLEKKGSKGQSYCTNIVQINFNAWHYVDDHLLASLVDHVFDRLGTHVSPEKTDAQLEAEYKENILRHEDEIKKAQELEAITKQTIAEKEKELELLKQKREDRKIAFNEWTQEDFEKILGEDTAGKIKESIKEMGIPDVVNSVSDLKQVVSEARTTRGRMASLFFSILNSKNKTWLVVLLVFVLLIVPLTFWLIHKYTDMDAITANIWSLLSEITIIISTIGIVVKKALVHVNSAISVVDDARKKIEEVITAKKSIPTDEENALEKEIKNLQVAEQKANTQFKNATEQIESINSNLEALRKERSLTKFLSDRRNSGDYKKHLGVISTIRRDFQDLIQRLEYSRTHQDTTYVPVDRIVLYIDDLDRCPAPKVMEVLQAVHLLLAYELFVVVVGVDPHWLLRSLESEHSVFQDKESSNVPEVSWQGTPQSFLEKIFQIPFRLRTMTNTGYGKLMKELFGSSDDDAGTTGNRQQSGSQNNAQQSGSTGVNTDTASGNDTLTGATQAGGASARKDDAGTPPSGSAGQTNTPPGNSPPQPVVDEESLIITPWETQFAEDLFALVPTPRSAKRFANVYCILKASVGLDQLSAFEGTAESPGEFQVPMLLLAILIGSPKEAMRLFPPLSKRGDILFALQQVSTGELPGSPFGILTGKIQGIVNASSFPVNTDLFEYWTSQVSRFSFELILNN